MSGRWPKTTIVLLLSPPSLASAAGSIVGRHASTGVTKQSCLRHHVLEPSSHVPYTTELQRVAYRRSPRTRSLQVLLVEGKNTSSLLMSSPKSFSSFLKFYYVYQLFRLILHHPALLTSSGLSFLHLFSIHSLLSKVLCLYFTLLSFIPLTILRVKFLHGPCFCHSFFSISAFCFFSQELIFSPSSIS